MQPANPDPDSLALVRNRLLWRNWNLTILIYRPILLRWAARRWAPLSGSGTATPDAGSEDPFETECRLRCLQNARLTISSISDYMANYMCTRLGAWYMLYVFPFHTYYYQGLLSTRTTTASNVTNSYFLFQAGLIPIVFLMTDPSNPEAASWLQDIETTKSLLTHPSLGTNRFATRCLEVINRLLGPPTHPMPQGIPTEGDQLNPQHQQQHEHMLPQLQPNMMPFPGQLFSDPGFGGSLFPVEQQMQMHNAGGMDFSEWVNFPPAE